MKFKLLFALALISSFSFAQIRGKVTDSKGNALPYASVTVEKTYNGTSTNENGEYELNIKKTGTYTLVFQILGYKTQTVTKEVTSFPATINATLSDEEYSIEEVVVKTGENPANGIIRSAIANRKKNTDKTDKFEADFYSRGIFRVKDIPKKFMGVEVPVHTGGEMLAKKYDMNVIFLKTKKIKRGYYEASFEVLSEDVKSVPDYKISEDFMARVEQQIYEQPEYYLWTHKRWKHKKAH